MNKILDKQVVTKPFALGAHLEWGIKLDTVCLYSHFKKTTEDKVKRLETD